MVPDVERLLELQRFLGLFNEVERVTHRKHGETYVRENDTEHSYNLAMTAWYLSGSFPELDLGLLLKYSLVHDLVEAYAGDTYIYGNQADLLSKATREAEAFIRIEREWKDFEDMSMAIRGYEDRLDPEARFVYALDKIMPILLIYINGGYTWKREGVTVEMLYRAKHDKVALSPEILPYFEKIHELLLTRPDLIKKF